MSPSPSADAVNPDSPSAPSLPTRPRVSPLFQPPTPNLSEPSPSSRSTEPSDSPSPPPADATAAPSWSTSAPSESSPAADASSGILSTGRDLKLSKTGLKAAIGSGFKQVCRLVAAFVADEEERALGVWAPEVEDVEAVARPAANLVYRRLPDEARGGDMIDVMALGLAVAGYVAQSLSRRAQLRTARRLHEAGGVEMAPGGVAPE